MQINDSKYESIISTLRAIGMQAFIQFYYDFKDASLSDTELAEKMFLENPRARSKQQRFRIHRARYLFQNGYEIEALEIIANSNRIPVKTKNLALCIMKKEIKSQIAREKESDEEQFLSELNNDIVYSLTNEQVLYNNKPEPARHFHEIKHQQYYRNKTVSKNALKIAEYKCEVDSKHELFIRKNSNINYTEPHHLVPISAYKDFPNINLDREQNIVSLCSHCHNQLHYGKDIDKILLRLYDKREKLLKSIGIDISYEELKEYYL